MFVCLFGGRDICCDTCVQVREQVTGISSIHNWVLQMEYYTCKQGIVPSDLPCWPNHLLKSSKLQRQQCRSPPLTLQQCPRERVRSWLWLRGFSNSTPPVAPPLKNFIEYENNFCLTTRSILQNKKLKLVMWASPLCVACIGQ